MSREDLINTTRSILAKGGFDVSSALNLRSICFDIVGRKDDTLLLIKILSNVDAFSRDNAEEMKVLAEALGATPVLIGENSSSGPLEAGIVYSRFKIPIISNETLADHVIEEVPPFIFAAPGGLYVRIDSGLLKHLRENNGISLGTLAETAGVSRRTIQMYESGMGAMIDAAMRLEEFLNVPIIQALNPFEYKSEKKSDSYEVSGESRTRSRPLNHLLDIGFSITPVIKSPFEAITRSQQMTILTGLGTDEEKLIQKALIASEISRIAGRHSLMIVEKKHSADNINSTAIVSNAELEKIDDKQELTDIVLSRSTKK
ncbi:MAG: transcriptional regulator [Candidatus Cloacimonetes bacterium]|nr:transcriptional regulator [Candidatus Cloacimonadota bacterium]MDD3379317.1 transcriptional regulator [Candidatus Methanomethylophilaceae archaeon]